MPYRPKDAPKYTKKADTPKEQRQWSHVFNKALARGASEASAFKQAAGVIRKGDKKK